MITNIHTLHTSKLLGNIGYKPLNDVFRGGVSKGTPSSLQSHAPIQGCYSCTHHKYHHTKAVDDPTTHWSMGGTCDHPLQATLLPHLLQANRVDDFSLGSSPTKGVMGSIVVRRGTRERVSTQHTRVLSSKGFVST